MIESSCGKEGIVESCYAPVSVNHQGLPVGNPGDSDRFYYKYENNKLPIYLANIPFNTNTSIHSHATRTQNKIHILNLKPNHEYAKIVYRMIFPLMSIVLQIIL